MRRVLALCRPLAVTVLAFFALSRSAHAANIVWNGGTGVWSVGTNWVGGVAPGSSDIATFTGSTAACSISSSISVAGISISVPVTITQASGVTITLSGGFTQNAGTFNGGNSTISIGGDLTLSSGTFKSTSGQLQVKGAFNKTGGTFTHNSGQVMLLATSSKTFASNGATFNNLTINDGLAGYWKMDDASGSNAVDSSGYGNTGTAAVAPTWATSSLPSLQFTDKAAVTLNGSSQFVDVPASVITTSSPFTACAWVKFNSVTGNQTFVSMDGTNVSAFYFKKESDTDSTAPNKLALEIYAADNGSSTQFRSAGTTTVTTGTWYHACGVYTGSVARIYVNGSQEGSDTTITSSFAATGHTIIGAAFWAARLDYVNGTLDDVRVYNRALSATEISALAAGNQPGTYLATQTLTGSPTVNGDLILASGSLSMGTNTISLAGNWWNYGGVLSASYWAGAAINLTGSATTNTILSGGQFMPSLNLTGTGKWTLADDLDVDPNATVTMTTGSLDVSSRTLRTGALASGSGTLTTTGATVILDGTSNQTLSVTPQNNLRVEDASETNLVGYWKFDEAQGTSARDWTGNGYTATLTNGAAWTTTVPPKVEFYDPAGLTLSSASSQYADSWATVTATNAAYTACGWIYMLSTAGHQALVSIDGTNISAFFLKKDGVTGNFSYTIYASDSTGAANAYVNGSTTPSANTWYHVCGVYTGSVARLYVNGTQEGADVTVSSAWSATGHTIIGASKWNGARSDLVNGYLDDVRIYNVALTAAQIKHLANGRYANTGGTVTATLGGNVTANGAVNIDSGTLDPGSSTLTASGGLTVRNAGTLKLDTGNGAVALGSGTTLTVDGTLYASASRAAIKSSSGTYAFKVGSTSTATPTLNINGLIVKNTDANGMWIDANTSATTTFTKFDGIAFSNGTSGGELLQIYATSLNLSSAGCTFDSGINATTTYSVKLTGNGTSDGETRIVFGGSTCALNAASCQASKSDDDANNDGMGDTVGNAAIVQFIRGVADDTAGSVVGFPTAAFDWSSFTYYSTYVAFHNASSGTTDMVYVRDESGNARYSWTVPTSGATITGTPQWTTIGGNHVLFVATSAGKVYRLVDSGTALAPDTGTAWSTNPFDCSCTISTPLAMDGNNLYWGSTTSGKNFWTLGISNESNPTPVAITPAVTNTALSIATVSGTSYAFMGVTGNILKISTAGQVISATNSSPGTASVWGRIVAGYNKSGSMRVYAGDDGGNMWAIDPGSGFTTANGLWHYTTSNPIKGSPYYDHDTDTIHYGTQGGTVIVLGSTGAVLNASYPYTPAGGAGDPITAAPLYYSGVLVVGSTGGKLYFLDRNTGTTPGVSLIKEYFFGSSESVSSVGYDPALNRYMVTTSNPSANDGRVYFFDQLTDPTSGSS